MPTPTMIPIATYTISGTQSYYTFSSIPDTYTDLVCIINGSDTRGDVSDSLTLRFNGDSGSNYSNTDCFGLGPYAYSSQYSNQDFMRIASLAGASSSSLSSISEVHIMNYKNTNIYKTAIGRGTVAEAEVSMRVGIWRSTAAINSVTFYAQTGIQNWTVGTTLTLYGIH